MDLIQAIAERRARIAELSDEREALIDEVDQLEKAKDLVENILAGKAMKPPPECAGEEGAARAS